MGRLLSVTESTGSETYSYDNMGRITSVSKSVNGVPFNTFYQYNLLGEIKQITYPSGRVINQNYDNVGRLSSISPTSGSAYLTVTSYHGAGMPKATTYGNGVAGTFNFNDRLQLAKIRYSKTGSPDLFNTDYGYSQSTNNNGQIQFMYNNLNSNLSVTYSYDQLGRLKRAKTNSTSESVADTFDITWTYDRYGNRTLQDKTAGSLGVAEPNLAFDKTTNRIVGVSYDASGNLTNDGVSGAFTYDAENRINSIGGVPGPYVYDGAGLKIKNSTTLYIYAGAKVIAEYPAASTTPTSPSKEYVYSGSQLLATITGSTVKYSYPDHLSTRLETNASGVATRSFGHLPFGDQWYEYGATGTSNWKFTSYERDSGTGLDYAIFRNMNWRQGRFTTADKLAGNLGDPQTLNRFTYTRNDPINFRDPLGLWFMPMCRFTTVHLDSREGGPGEFIEVLQCGLINIVPFVSPEEPGGHGPSDILDSAFTSRLQDCIKSLFGSGGPSNTSQLPNFGISDGTIVSPQGGHARGTYQNGQITLDRDYYTTSSFSVNVATYVHELGNYLSDHMLGTPTARPLNADRARDLFGGDQDSGASLEDCVYGGAVQDDGTVLNVRDGVFIITNPN